MTTFINTVLAIAFMEVILKPITVRVTKRVLKWIDNHVDFIPDWLYTLTKEN